MMIKVIFLFCAFASVSLQSSVKQLDILEKFYQNDYKVKFERLDVVYFNEDFIKRFEIVTFKHNRTCTATNVSVELNVDFGNKLEVVVQAYKFMSNEYRQFPVRIQINLCLAISKNIIGLADSYKCGNFTGCPLLKGKAFRACNWKIDESRLPPFIPDGRYMDEMQLVYGSTEVAFVRRYGEIYRPITYI